MTAKKSTLITLTRLTRRNLMMSAKRMTKVQMTTTKMMRIMMLNIGEFAKFYAVNLDDLCSIFIVDMVKQLTMKIIKIIQKTRQLD